MQVFAIGSAGVLNSDITQTCLSAGGTQTFTSDESDVAWGGGAGVKVFLGHSSHCGRSSGWSSARRQA